MAEDFYSRFFGFEEGGGGWFFFSIALLLLIDRCLFSLFLVSSLLIYRGPAQHDALEAVLVLGDIGHRKN